MYAEHWWFDASAEAIQSGYRSYAVKLANEGVIRDMSYDGLIPGDLAVTKNGVHMLAYLGDDMWIQADPGQMKVATQDGRNEMNAWFKSKVTTHRWTVLK